MAEDLLGDNDATLCALVKGCLAAALAVLTSKQQHWLSLWSVIQTSILRMVTRDRHVHLVRSVMCTHPA
jgi:hypothetical protein